MHLCGTYTYLLGVNSSPGTVSLGLMAGTWLSVVPTFRPPPESVELIGVLAASSQVLVSDDASPCSSDPTLAAIETISDVTVVRNSRNRGIGRALNHGLAAAASTGAHWLLTVDQDSAVTRTYAPSMVEHADRLLAAGLRIGAVGAGDVRDASGPLVYPTRTVSSSGEHVVVTEEVVQSGTLWSVDALQEFGGFDESLGMDAVDAAACLNLRSRGYLIALDPRQTIAHRIENAQQISLLGRSIIVTGHSPERRRAIVRNRLRLFPREFQQSPVHAVRTVRRGLVNYLAVPFRKRA